MKLLGASLVCLGLAMPAGAERRDARPTRPAFPAPPTIKAASPGGGGCLSTHRSSLLGNAAADHGSPASATCSRTISERLTGKARAVWARVLKEGCREVCASSHPELSRPCLPLGVFGMELSGFLTAAKLGAEGGRRARWELRAGVPSLLHCCHSLTSQW